MRLYKSTGHPPLAGSVIRACAPLSVTITTLLPSKRSVISTIFASPPVCCTIDGVVLMTKFGSGLSILRDQLARLALKSRSIVSLVMPWLRRICFWILPLDVFGKESRIRT